MNPLNPAEKDHKRIYGDFLYVYPVVSRRSRGVSLGVNLNPDKACNFDCVYCEVDRKTPPRTREVDLAVMEAELRALVEIWRDGSLFTAPPFDSTPGPLRRLNDIALSGDGEPTTFREFDRAVEIVARVRHELCPAETKIVLITDAAGLDRAAVRAGLEIMDAHNGEVWGKLDAGTPEYYRLVNRSSVPFQRVLDNLLATARVRPIHIQTLFLRINGEPPPDTEVAAYCGRLNSLKAGGAQIRSVQLYTVARPTPESWATALPLPELERLAAVIRDQTGLPVETFRGNE